MPITVRGLLYITQYELIINYIYMLVKTVIGFFQKCVGLTCKLRQHKQATQTLLMAQNRQFFPS